MSRISFGVAAAVFLIAGCTPATPEQQVVNDGAAALGGESRVKAVRSLVIEGDGTNFNLGQDMTPGASTQTFTLSGYRRAIDLPSARARTEQIRTPNFMYFQGPQAQKQVQGLDGEVAYNVGANGNATRVGPAAAEDRRKEFYHHPLTILRVALDPAAKLSNAQTVGSERQVDVATSAGVVTLAVDAQGLPTRVSSKTYHANLGDVVITTTFADYQDVNGLKLPAKLTTKTDDFTTAEIRAVRQTVDTDVSDLVAPAAVASAVTATPPAPTVTAEPVGKGVWLLAGQSHHSALVEFNDHLVLIEAPQNEARTLAVIAKARELKPDKPLKRIVMTHHHFDHTGGLRAAISEGLTVVTHSGNKAFVETMAKRPHTIRPDALAKNAKPVAIETVDDAVELKDGTMTVNLYHVAGNPHSDTMLMAYIPRERVLIQVDAFSGGQYEPYAANLLENVSKRKLRVDRIVPLHGTIVPFENLVKTQTTSSN